jgi:DNA-binding SARP family transcriptional activator/tetratricopeptide (TPR) repeat protein
VQFRVLGPVEAESSDGRVLVLGRRQERCLLGILLLEAGRVVPTDRLCDLLWEDNPPEQARRAVQAHVARIRAMLATEPGAELLSKGDGYLLRVAARSIDAAQFRTLVGEAGMADDLAERDRLLRQALALWRGVALQDAAGDRLRERLCGELDELRLHAVEESLAAGLALGRHNELIPELARRSAEHPTRERLVELHMLALYRAGRTADALSVYAATRARLAEQLGLEPGPALQQLQGAILRREPATPPASPTRARPAQLPPDPAAFTGRVEHLRQLDTVLAGAGTAVVISAIAGTAGVGKTALAVHWAHANADRFPDGQLYVNLRGFDPGGAAMAPADAVRGFLDALDVPPDRIPADFNAQVGLYRSLLADKRLLVVLDNARDTDQVRPLLPGARGCLALVTSRNELGGLVAAEGAHPITLDLLMPDEARRMLERRLGTARVAAEPEAMRDIITRCVRLPLALAIASARAVTHPTFPLSVLAAELRDARSGLDALDAGDAATDVRAVFSWSYRALGDSAARLFRLLGLHPGPDISTPAAASLAGVPLHQIRPLLAQLARAHLITEHKPGRYTLHDLLRAYATELAERTDREADRRAAFHRMFDHYLQAAYAAGQLLNPRRHSVTIAPPLSQTTAEDIAEPSAARDWFATEQPVLLAVFAKAAGADFDIRLWQLGWTMTDALLPGGHWLELLALQSAALQTATRHADIEGQANAHHGMATAYTRLGDYPAGRRHWEHALPLYAELGDNLAQGRTHLNLSTMYSLAAERADALSHAQRALGLFRAGGYDVWQARALNAVGWAYARVGDYETALVASQQALCLELEVGDLQGQADALESLGFVHHRLGRYDEAADYFQRSRQMWQEVGDRYYEANALVRLGDSRLDAGQAAAADETWNEALSILEQINHPDAEKVRARLDELILTSTSPADAPAYRFRDR